MSLQRAIFFDIDGTLAETAAYWLPVLEAFHAEVERLHGIRSQTWPLTECLKLLGTSDLHLLAKMYPGHETSFYRELHALSTEVWKPLVSRHPFKLYDGALEVVERLHSQGWRILLSSNCDNWYMGQMLTQTGLGRYVTGWACAEMHPGLEKWEFTQVLKSQMGECTGYFVGDSCSDMKAGRMNGLRTIYANYGYAQCPDLGMMDHQVENVREVLAAVEAGMPHLR